MIGAVRRGDGLAVAGVDGEVWIGLVEVRPLEGNDSFEGAPGAYTNVLTLASDSEEYETKIAGALVRAGFALEEVGEPEPLRERMSRVDISDEIVELGGRAMAGEVVWSTFHVFESEVE